MRRPWIRGCGVALACVGLLAGAWLAMSKVDEVSQLSAPADQPDSTTNPVPSTRDPVPATTTMIPTRTPNPSRRATPQPTPAARTSVAPATTRARVSPQPGRARTVVRPQSHRPSATSTSTAATSTTQTDPTGRTTRRPTATSTATSNPTSPVTTAPPVDRVPPGPVGTLAVNASDDEYYISWQPAIDNVGVVAYRVRIGGATQYATDTTIVVPIPRGSQRVLVEVNAVDAADNDGPASRTWIDPIEETPSPEPSTDGSNELATAESTPTP